MKFTFKTEKSTGKYSSFYPDFHYIKLKKVEVGMIDDNSPHSIRLKVVKDDITEDGNTNCDWKWVKLKAEFNSIDDAKIFLNDKIDQILQKYKLVEK